MNRKTSQIVMLAFMSIALAQSACFKMKLFNQESQSNNEQGLPAPAAGTGAIAIKSFANINATMQNVSGQSLSENTYNNLYRDKLQGLMPIYGRETEINPPYINGAISLAS